MTTKTYMPIGDIPQRVLDGCKDEFGMQILHLPELRTRYGTVYATQRDIVVIADCSNLYCPTCGDYVDTVQEIGITYVTDLPDESECLWDEIGEPFCPDCQETYFTDSEEQYVEDARQSYLSDMADAMRKGEW
jgi:hypothetical protein